MLFILLAAAAVLATGTAGWRIARAFAPMLRAANDNEPRLAPRAPGGYGRAAGGV